MKKLFIVALTMASAGAFADVVDFDSITNNSVTYSTSTPHSLMGAAFSLGTATAPTAITGLDMGLVFQAAASYSDVVAQITIFGTASNATSGTTAAFTNALATYRVDLGALSTTAASNYFLYSTGSTASAGTNGGIGFSSPLTIASGTNLGIQISYLANSGNGLVANDNLTSLLVTGSGPTVGSWTAGTAGTNGYYRNASLPNQTGSNVSLLGSDFRSFSGGTNEGLALRVFTQPAPEPISTVIVAGALGAAIARRRRNRA